MLSQNIEWSDEDEVKIDAAWAEIALERDDYPAEVLRYGDPGKMLYNDQVAALVGIDVPLDEARSDVLALWDTLVKAKSLQLVE